MRPRESWLALKIDETILQSALAYFLSSKFKHPYSIDEKTSFAEVMLLTSQRRHAIPNDRRLGFLAAGIENL
jgi:hypothetical protein